jgi:hypothetical protein
MGWKVQALILLVSQTPRSTVGSSQQMVGAPSLAIKWWLGCEADHSRPSNAEAKNEWSCTYVAVQVLL